MKQLIHDNPNATARSLFLGAALLSFALSVGLFFAGEETSGIFVGLWVPSILALGAFLAAPNRHANGRRGMSVGIFIYGTVVFGLVVMALGLLAWGIVSERRDRTSLTQARRVFGEPSAALEVEPRAQSR